MSDDDGEDMDVLNDLMSVRSGRYLLSSKATCAHALPG